MDGRTIEWWSFSWRNTLPETNSKFAPENGWLVGSKMNFLLGRGMAYLQGRNVSFREGIWCERFILRERAFEESRVQENRHLIGV